MTARKILIAAIATTLLHPCALLHAEGKQGSVPFFKVGGADDSADKKKEETKPGSPRKPEKGGLLTGAQNKTSEIEQRIEEEIAMLEAQRLSIEARIQKLKDLLEIQDVEAEKKKLAAQQKKQVKQAQAEAGKTETKADRAARNYGKIEDKEKLTRLRTVGKPYVVWTGGSEIKVSEISVEVRNYGSVAAKKISVVAVLPGGEEVRLKGPKELSRYDEATYTAEPGKAVPKGGKVDIELRCQNCRR